MLHGGTNDEPAKLANTWQTQLLTAGAAFATYFCMYAFRKPFAVAAYANVEALGVGAKTWFVCSQIIGYALSKYLGVRYLSEAPRWQRLRWLLGLVGLSELALIGFGALPFYGKVCAMFLNGLPLGMIWGLVVRYLEGRRSSDFLLACLSCSFIVASGVVKDAGRWLMTSCGIPEYWMPAATGLLFAVPFVLASLLLDQAPEPSAQDVAARKARPPMDAVARAGFFRSYWPGLVPLLAGYFALTAFRDYRDNYGVELFHDLGVQQGLASLFTRTESLVALLVLCTLAGLGVLQSPRQGLIATFALMILGFLGVAGASALQRAGSCSPTTYMVLSGFGIYLAYVPFSSFLFDRVMACTAVGGTAIFAINLSDAIGYTGSVGMQLTKDLLVRDHSRLEFFQTSSILLGSAGAVLTLWSGMFFIRQANKHA
jgi:Family of unknown function (DUF5690)